MNKLCDDAIHCGCSDISEDLEAENRQLKCLLKTIRTGLERPSARNSHEVWKQKIDEMLGADYD